MRQTVGIEAGPTERSGFQQHLKSIFQRIRALLLLSVTAGPHRLHEGDSAGAGPPSFPPRTVAIAGHILADGTKRLFRAEIVTRGVIEYWVMDLELGRYCRGVVLPEFQGPEAEEAATRLLRPEIRSHHCYPPLPSRR